MLLKKNKIFILLFLFIPTFTFAELPLSSRDQKNIEVIIAGKQYRSFQEYEGIREDFLKDNINVSLMGRHVLSSMSREDRDKIKQLVGEIEYIEQKYVGRNHKKNGTFSESFSVGNDFSEMSNLLKVFEQSRGRSSQINLDEKKIKTIVIERNVNKLDDFLEDEVHRDMTWMLESYEKKKHKKSTILMDPQKMKTIVLE